MRFLQGCISKACSWLSNRAVYSKEFFFHLHIKIFVRFLRAPSSTIYSATSPDSLKWSKMEHSLALVCYTCIFLEYLADWPSSFSPGINIKSKTQKWLCFIKESRKCRANQKGKEEETKKKEHNERFNFFKSQTIEKQTGKLNRKGLNQKAKTKDMMHTIHMSYYSEFLYWIRNKIIATLQRRLEKLSTMARFRQPVLGAGLLFHLKGSTFIGVLFMQKLRGFVTDFKYKCHRVANFGLGNSQIPGGGTWGR